MKRVVFPVLLAVALLIGTPVQAAVFSSNDNPMISEELRDDAFLAGESVSITAPIFGELFGAGSTVSVQEKVDRSIYAAGNTVTVSKGSGYNAFLAGNMVTLSGEYGHDVYAAGSTVVITEGTVINGNLYVGAEALTLNGTVKGNVQIGADVVTSNTIVGGNMKIDASTVDFTGGSIGKDLTYTSRKEAKGKDKVTVAGKTDYKKSDSNKSGDAMPFVFLPFLAGAILFGLGSMLALGALLVWLTPKKSTHISDEIKNNWGSAFTTGLVGLIMFPIAAMVAYMTLIGWPIGIIITLSYIVLLMLAGSYGAIAIGKMVQMKFSKSENLWLALLIGVVGLSLLKSIPYFGGLISLVAFFGLTIPALGAILNWWKEKFQEK